MSRKISPRRPGSGSAWGLLQQDRRRISARRTPTLERLEDRELLSLSTITSLTLPPTDPVAGRPFSLTATVTTPSGGTPTGTVTFYDGPVALGTATLADIGGVETATLDAPAPAAGPHLVWAVYNGDSFDTYGNPNGTYGQSSSMSGRVTTLAGTGVNGYSGDGGPATAAQVNAPRGIAVDNTGNVYFADSGSYHVRKITPDGIISTIADGSDFSLRPSALAVDPSGNVFVSDGGDVIKLTPAGARSTVFSYSEHPIYSQNAYYPIAVDGAGNLFVGADSEWGNNTPHGYPIIYEVKPDGSTTLIAAFDSYQPIKNMTADASGHVFVYASGQVSLVEPDGSLTPLFHNFPGAAYMGLATDGAGNLFATSWPGVYEGRAGGAVAPVFPRWAAVPEGPKGQSAGLALDAAGNLYISDTFGARLLRVDRTPNLNVRPLTSVDVQSLLDAPGSGGSVTIQPTSSAVVSMAVDAINGLSAPPSGTAETVTLDLGGGSFTTDTHIQAPAGVTVVVVNGTLIGGSPALIVDSGNVVLRGVTARNATDAPTIVVNGGTLVVRNSVVEESTGYAQVAIRINGGTLDLGTATDPGGNYINTNGVGVFILNASGSPFTTAIGDTFRADGAVLASTVNGLTQAPRSLSGIVFADFNNDGQVDFGERGISGVTVRLDGTDFLGNPVHLSQPTDDAGAYVFQGLRPGSYTISEAQPAGYTQGINSIGTGGGSVSGDSFTLALAANSNALTYNYGERPAAGGTVRGGQTAGIGFWNNRNGQALIQALNGGATSTQLGNWLATTFPHMFGVLSGSNNLVAKNNAYVAAYFQSLFTAQGPKLDAQVLATALSVYATNTTLDSTGVAAQYGFTVSGYGAGTATVNVGGNGAAFGVADNTVLTVMDVLLAADAQAVNGVLYNRDTVKRNKANNVFSAINQAGRL